MKPIDLKYLKRFILSVQFYENFLILYADYAQIKGNEMKKVITIKIISMLLFMIPLTTSSAHHHTTKDAKHEKIKKDGGNTQDDKVVKTNQRSRTNTSDSSQRKNTYLIFVLIV